MKDGSIQSDPKISLMTEMVLVKFTRSEFDLSRYYIHPYCVDVSNYDEANKKIIIALNSTGLPSLEYTLFGGISNG